MEYFNYNGKIYKNDVTVISVNSRGLRFGDGLFETLKSSNNKLQFAADHFERLWKGMDLLQFKVPVHFTAENLLQQILKLVNKNGHNNMARVRITVFRGDGGLYDEINHTPHYIIQTWALPDDTGKWNSNGLLLEIYSDVKKSCDMLSNLKHNNFLPYVMAALHAKKQKCNDAILLNNHGRICDTTIANIFLIKGDVIHTPSLDEGCIAGIMRKNIISQLIKDNLQVFEGEITVDDLLNADEVFLSNSIYNIRWIQRIGDKEFTNRITQKIYTSFLSTIS
ncbi:MAG: aminotransferase class IV [Ferruginibacter sp.]